LAWRLRLVATAIGFRVSPRKVTYAVVRAPSDGTFTIAALGEVCVPYALETPRQLRFIRTTLLDIIEDNGSVWAGLRIGESTAQQRDPFRLNLEGVVQELLASSDVERFVAGPIATIASLLRERDRTVIKQFITGKKPPMVKAEWAKLDDVQREAVLVAMCAAARRPAPGGASQ
jgi:hypothetical protein